jgi:hypothetical protein
MPMTDPVKARKSCIRVAETWAALSERLPFPSNYFHLTVISLGQNQLGLSENFCMVKYRSWTDKEQHQAVRLIGLTEFSISLKTAP